MRLFAGELPAGELTEALTSPVVGPERLIVRVLRISRDLLRDGANLTVQRFVVIWIAQQRFDPVVVSILVRPLLVEQQLPEQKADADIREGAEREDAMPRTNELVDLGVFRLDLRNDVADRLVDQWKPDLLGARHSHRISEVSYRRARQAI